MQSAVSRDVHGRTQYAMVAVDPGRVRKVGLDNRWLEAVCAAIMATFEAAGPVKAGGTEPLCQVVNFNVHKKQYVVAGDIRCLCALQLVCDQLNKNSESKLPLADTLTVLVPKACKARPSPKPLIAPRSVLASTL